MHEFLKSATKPALVTTQSIAEIMSIEYISLRTLIRHIDLFIHVLWGGAQSDVTDVTQQVESDGCPESRKAIKILGCQSTF